MRLFNWLAAPFAALALAVILLGAGQPHAQVPTLRAALTSATQPTWAVDFRAGVPASMTFSRASGRTCFDGTLTLVTLGNNVPCLYYDPATGQPWGYLGEMQRTNSVRNGVVAGAVPGSPGTLPTNSTMGGVVGTTVRTIIGSGTEDGIPYWDVRWQSTGESTTSSFDWEPELRNAIAASVGQAWTGSVYARIVGGSSTNLTFAAFTAETNGSIFLAGSGVPITLTTAPLKTQRFSTTRTLSVAGTTNVGTAFQIKYTSGQPFDITIRFGAPQIELGTDATSSILTSGAAATRSQDILRLPLTNLPGWNPNAGGVLTAAYRLHGVHDADYPNVFFLNDGTSANSISLDIRAASSLVGLRVISGGVTQFAIDNGAEPAPFVRDKVAVGWSTSHAASARNGASLLVQNATAALPIGMTTLSTQNGSTSLNGTLERIAYYAGARSDAFVQAVSR